MHFIIALFSQHMLLFYLFPERYHIYEKVLGNKRWKKDKGKDYLRQDKQSSSPSLYSSHLGTDAQGHSFPFWFNWSEVGPWAYHSNMQPRLSDLSITGCVIVVKMENAEIVRWYK